MFGWMNFKHVEIEQKNQKYELAPESIKFMIELHEL
jgi:hypothetical protein